uniref:Uncharacterized protein n=1 Tax=Myoviridae sp. ctIty1 TaxID=2827673 RepID=A0A8S5TGF7_9CAUD|nr:MAG TPA: hypothetical protein [Myoviridae sp. ctIty1]
MGNSIFALFFYLLKLSMIIYYNSEKIFCYKKKFSHTHYNFLEIKGKEEL